MEIPNKSLFNVDEVCGITAVKPYVLRFWESEFEQLSPITSSSGQKLYRAGDIRLIAEIKKLLFDQKLTVERARAQICGVPLPKEKPTKNRKNQKTSQNNSKAETRELADLEESLRQLVATAESIKQERGWLQ